MINSKTIEKLFWAESAAETAVALDTDARRGLLEKEAKGRLAIFGENRFGKDEKPSVLAIFFRQFQSPLIVILIVASVITLFLREWTDAAIIILAVTVNTFLGFYQERKAERAVADLRSYIQERARVVRDGREREVDAAVLVPGDIIHISQGMRVPADARLINIQNLQIDESILTGEALPVAKEVNPISKAAIVTERKNMVFGGTLITEGMAHAIVTATGASTEIGKLARLVAITRHERTPLQKAVLTFSWLIAAGISMLVLGIFALGVSRGETIFDMLIVSIAVVVGAIPEALPVGLTAVLAVGIERVARRKGIMRNLIAAETLGSTTLIMIDKTGTLTEARMKLIDVILAGDLVHSDKPRESSKENFSEEQKDILRLAVLNTDIAIENPNEKPEDWQISGRPLETNIVRAAAVQGIDPFGGDMKDISRMILPFNSAYKFSVARANVSLVTELLGVKQGKFLIVMGAPDVLLERSELGKSEYIEMLKQVDEMSERGQRLLGIAVARVNPDSENNQVRAESLRGLIFVGLLGFRDSVRGEVPETMRKIERYGVRIVMATGDLKGTAVAVAREIGWKVSVGEVLTGEEIRQFDDKKLKEALAYVRIFARVTPEDKLRIAQLYKKRGEIVAMTGDGVNDAPSLKAANIGIAVGSGSDVAKGVADLVLLDDKLSTIVAAIEEGKRMLLNIRKIFVYLMSNSLDEVVLIGGSLMASLALPLSAVQIIWVNLFTGSLPAMAFAFDRDGDLERTKRITPKILDNEVKFLTLGIGILTSILLFLLYWLLIAFSVELSTARSVLFTCFASYILVISFSLRNLRRPLFSYPFFENKFLVAGVAIGLTLLVATVYTPALRGFFGIVAIAPVWLFLVAGWLALNIALVEGAKWLFYRRDKHR